MSTGGALAVIPARGGSRRVPRKNIHEMHSRPLLAYLVEATLRSGLFARVVVSTDDAEIAAVAQALGADVPLLRPPALADAMTPVSQATIDHLADRTGWEIDWTHTIDIDTEEDWRLAEALMRRS